MINKSEKMAQKPDRNNNESIRSVESDVLRLLLDNLRKNEKAKDLLRNKLR